MNLKSLNRNELDQRMKSLAQQERELLHDIILTIKEIDSRKLFLEFGFPSLFAYLVDEVGYAAGSAQRRIDAARLLRDVPSLGEKIASGEIGLGQIAMVQKASRDVFQRTAVKVPAEDKKDLIEQIANMDHRTSQKEVAAFFDLPVIQNTEQKIQADESVRVSLTLSKKLDVRIKEAQALLSHALGDNELITYLDYVTERIIKQKTSVRASAKSKKDREDSVDAQVTAFEDTIKTMDINNTPYAINADNAASPMAENPSTATVEVNGFSTRNKKIIINEQDCCQFVNPNTGKICGSRWFRQVDHKQSRWADGSGAADNGQVLCAAHNQMKYRREAGIRMTS